MLKKKKSLRNVTLSADPALIDMARDRAMSENRSLNDAFRQWLEQFTRPLEGRNDFAALMKSLAHVEAGRRFSRDEMNER